MRTACFQCTLIISIIISLLDPRLKLCNTTTVHKGLIIYQSQKIVHSQQNELHNRLRVTMNRPIAVPSSWKMICQMIPSQRCTNTSCNAWTHNTSTNCFVPQQNGNSLEAKGIPKIGKQFVRNTAGPDGYNFCQKGLSSIHAAAARIV